MSTKSPKKGLRVVTEDGPNVIEVLNVLRPDLGKKGTEVAVEKASKIIELSVDPTAGKPPKPSDGLLYGLIQSGKTSILTVSAAMAADNGFDCLLVLTTDNDPLYDQTLDRVRAALGGITVLGKKDWKDPIRFAKQLRSKPFAIVCSKNGSILKSLLDAFQNARAKNLSVFIIDDEADQASLNTFTSKKNSGKVSPVNKVITDFRAYFPVNTYLQVTATPQALFLQRPDHQYHPSFTVLTEPGPSYIGGDAFFGSGSKDLLRFVLLNEVTLLTASNQPKPSGTLPSGLRKALFTFLVGAATKVIERPSEGFAFLLHVSMGNKDHEYARQLLDDFKAETIQAFSNKGSTKYKALLAGLKDAYSDLSTTEKNLPPFHKLEEKIEFYIKGANIKLVNATSNDEIKLDSKFNIFVGGNKLGRGVTIKNLLVSYYGRNPKRPKADTVLQHARMYGYRSKDLGVTRLFLPQRLANHFRSIHEMETELRDLLREFPDGGFEGLYISGPWDATRKNVLDPNSIGYYAAGKNVTLPHPLRSEEATKTTEWLDNQLASVKDSPPYQTITMQRVLQLIERIPPDPQFELRLWNLKALEVAFEVLKTQFGDKAYLVVKRDRDLKAARNESQTIYSGREPEEAPRNGLALFLYRANATPDGEVAVWWPQLRFPVGNYVLAFSFDW